MEYAIFSEQVNTIYRQAVKDYHLYDSIDTLIRNPFSADKTEHLFYLKCWIDTVQWHVEDEIRNPDINPRDALTLKRRIDALNQERTNTVELIDDHFLKRFKDVEPKPFARVNTESPAWALDRLSILVLKIYHMDAETNRRDASADHIAKCRNRLGILREQQKDLSCSINELLQDIANGNKYMKTYRQMKMYNDANLNPVLYKNNEHAKQSTHA